jgi:hypothetical protein
MNIAKVRNSAAFVNYVKPKLEMLEMEIESVLCMSFTSGGEGPKEGDGGPAPSEGGGGVESRSSRSRIRR